MVFKELGKNIGENQYYKENCYDESKSKISLHLRISPETANAFTKAIAVYREFGVDKFILSSTAAVYGNPDDSSKSRYKFCKPY